MFIVCDARPKPMLWACVKYPWAQLLHNVKCITVLCIYVSKPTQYYYCSFYHIFPLKWESPCKPHFDQGRTSNDSTETRRFNKFQEVICVNCLWMTVLRITTIVYMVWKCNCLHVPIRPSKSVRKIYNNPKPNGCNVRK